MIESMKNQMPSDESESVAKFWSIIDAHIISVFLVFLLYVLLFEVLPGVELKYFIFFALLFYIIMTPFFTMYAFAGYVVEARCPHCKKSFCIKYIGTETVAESLTKKVENDKIKLYRVGIERIHWVCKNCGEEGIGEKEYKREE